MVNDIWLYYAIFLLVVIFCLMMSITYLTSTRIQISKCVQSTASYGVLPGYSCSITDGSTTAAANLVSATLQCDKNALCKNFVYDGANMSICNENTKLIFPDSENTLNNVFIKQNE
jgi:hypothetical protein